MKNIIYTLLLFLPFCVNAQLDRSIVPSPGDAPQINIKDSKVFKTENGITVIISENHKIPKVSFSLLMGADPLLEKDKTGLSDMAGSLITSGTNTRTKDKLDSEIDYIGASISASAASLRLSCLKKHVDKGLSLMSDVLLNAKFPQSEFDRIKKQMESALLNTKSDPSSMASNASSKVNFPNHPYGEVMTEETLNNISLEDIKNYYTKTFIPDGSYLVVVGDVTEAETRNYVQNYFSSWNSPNKANQKETSSFISSKGNKVFFIKKPGAVQSVIEISFPIDIGVGSEDEIALKVLNKVFGGGGFGNRLMQNLREDKAYTYGCYSSLDIDEHGSMFSAGGNFRNEVTDSAITEILSEFAKIREAEITDKEINLTKSSMAGAFARSLERPSTISNFAARIIKYNLDKDYYKTYLKRLNNVSKADVLAMAKKYLTAENCNIIVVGNEEVIPTLEKFDNDGKVQLLDAFGNVVKNMKPSDISKEDLICKYISKITMTTSSKERAKKIKKAKSILTVSEMSSAQMPVKITMTTYQKAPYTEATKVEGQGMVFMRSYFDGNSGNVFNMQTGQKAMTADEIASKKKSKGYFPELYYDEMGVKYDLIGIENIDGNDCYVVKRVDGENQSFDYYDKNSCLKIKSLTIVKTEDKVNESTITYGDYKEVNGFLFPHSNTTSFGPTTFNSKVKEIIFNQKFDLTDFK
ncbi:MAG: insulinase family protein [Crocinitomicaceae bacterium]|nr:insulinase family protein [Crocinitomicaceae bacterium]